MDQNKLKYLDCVEDWTLSSESIINKLSTENFIKEGIKHFDHVDSKNFGGPIPYLITSSYPSAMDILKFVEARIDKSKYEKFTLLDIGAGSGLFARNFLLAAKDNGLLNKVKVLISDISKNSLIAMKERKIHGEFKEGENFDYIELDMTSLNTAKYLDGNPVKIENIDYITMNYAIDALPSMILQKDDNRVLVEESKTYINNQLISDIKDAQNFKKEVCLDFRFKETNWEELEEKLGDSSEIVKRLFDESKNGCFAVPVKLLNCLENFTKCLRENGLIIIRDITHNSEFKNIENPEQFSLLSGTFYRNTYVRSISVSLLAKLINFSETMNAKSFVSIEHTLSFPYFNFT